MAIAWQGRRLATIDAAREAVRVGDYWIGDRMMWLVVPADGQDADRVAIGLKITAGDEPVKGHWNISGHWQGAGGNGATLRQQIITSSGFRGRFVDGRLVADG